MTAQICTDVVELDKDVKDIEAELQIKLGREIIRWAVVEVAQNTIKVCYSYKSK